MNISLPNGKVVRRSVEEYLFLEDAQMDAWYQGMMADDLGEEIENPWVTLTEVRITEYKIPDIDELDA